MDKGEQPKMDGETKKILSQWEIDSLLGSLAIQETQDASIAPESVKNVRPYDFRRPDKFSKEHLRALQMIHESFARGATSSLSSSLRAGIQVRLTSIEQAVYGEYLQQLANPTSVSIVRVDPLPGHIIIEINLGLAFALIDRLLGGSGQLTQKSREVTDIELVLLQTLVKSILAPLREAWLQIRDVAMKLDDLVFNPQVVQSSLPGDIGVLLLFDLRMGDTSDTMTMLIPFALLEPVMGKLTSQMWLTGVRKDVKSGQEEIRRQLEKVKLPVTVSLGETSVSVRDLLGLQKGNVIRLDTSASQELQVLVSRKHKYLAKPGRSGRRIAVSVTRAVNDGSTANV